MEKCKIRIAILLSAIALAMPSHADSPKVVVTIKPVHSLAAAVMKGVGEPSLLIDGAQSPHHFHLKPSDARRLHNADLLVRVDDRLENFLAGILDSLSEKTRAMTLAEEIDSRFLLSIREGGIWDSHEHKEESEHHDDLHSDDNHRRIDSHLWLSPKVAEKIAEAIADELITIDKENARHYRENLRALKIKLAALDDEINKRLAQVHERRFLVFHDAYQYFEGDYNLNAAGSIKITPHAPLSALHLRRLKELKEGGGGIVCIFAEPQFDSRATRRLAEEIGARFGIADPLGAKIIAGESAYFEIMRDLADSFAECLIGDFN